MTSREMDENRPAYDAGEKKKEAKRTWAQKCAQKERPKPAFNAGAIEKVNNNQNKNKE